MATDLDKVGGISSITGTVQGMIGSYYAAETEKFKYKSMALGYEHKKDMAKINSRMLERQAQQVGRAYNRQIMIKTMQQVNVEEKLEQVLLQEVVVWVMAVQQIFLLVTKL